MIKLIALDFDGTLVSKTISNSQIDSEVLDLLKKFRMKGVVLVVATGRHPSYILKRVPEFSFDWIIGYSGNIVYKNEYIDSEKFSKFEVLFLQDYFKQNYDSDIFFYSKDAIAIASNVCNYQSLNLRLSRKDKMADFNGLSDKLIEEYVESNNSPVISRICLRMEDLDKLYDIIMTFNNSFTEYRLVKTGNRQAELLRKNKSKASEILKIADKLGIDKSEIATIGDDENDREMLQMFFNSFYVGDDNDSLEKIATYRDKNCKESLIKIMEENDYV